MMWFKMPRESKYLLKRPLREMSKIRVKVRSRRNERIRAWEFGRWGNRHDMTEETLLMSICSSVGILTPLSFLSVGKSWFSFPSAPSPHLLLAFLPRKGDGGLWFLSSLFLLDSHKEETQRCFQNAARAFPLLLNNNLHLGKLVRYESPQNPDQSSLW